MSLPVLLILLALWAQGALVFVIMPVLYRRRVPRVLRGEIKVADVAVDKSAWPTDARQASDAYSNQFELPVLFFVAGAGLIWLGTGWIEVVLAWAFVVSRCVHAYIHLTSNHVMRRFTAFATGVFIMAVLWLAFGVRIIAAFGAL